MKIGIASDHRGYLKKQKLTNYLEKKGYTIIDYGTDSIASVDYPDYAFKLGESLIANDIDVGIALCGTGIGMSIALNKIKKVRCAKVDSVKEACLAKNHNNANVIALSANTKSFLEIKDIVDAYLKSCFSTEEKHRRRVEKITIYEKRSLK